MLGTFLPMTAAPSEQGSGVERQPREQGRDILNLPYLDITLKNGEAFQSINLEKKSFLVK